MLIIEFLKRIIPTERNRQEHKETQQLIYVLNHSPVPELTDEDYANYEALCDLIDNRKAPTFLSHWRAIRFKAYMNIEHKVRKNWPDGIDELTPERIRELRQSLDIDLSEEGEAEAPPRVGLS